jgi:uracil permease
MDLKQHFGGKVILMGILHLLVAFTSIAVVTSIVGFNLPLAFLFAGIGTIVFHIVTKNKLPVTLGTSGLYIGSVLFVATTYGVAYAHGGIIVAGIMYLIFAMIMFKWQDKVLSLFPQWLLSTVVLLIGLSLLPIGVSLVQTSMIVGLTSLVVTALVDLLGGRKLGMFAMPIGVLAGTVVAFLLTGIPVMPTMAGIEYVAPMFNWQSALAIGLISIPVMFEMMGDTKNTGDIIGKDVFKEVGVGRISLGNGLATIMGGAGGSNAYTTFSENTAFVMLSKYYNASAQIWTGIFLIILAFLTPVSAIIAMIPMEAFGGVVTYLFAMIAVNAIKQIAQAVNLDTEPKTFAIMTIMVAISVLTITVGGVAISSVAIATLVGVILNSLFNRKRA